MGVEPARPRRPRPRGRLYYWFERTVLRFGMGIAAAFVERRLIKAMRGGGLKPAPRTADGQDEPAVGEGFDISRSAESALPSQEVPEEP